MSCYALRACCKKMIFGICYKFPRHVLDIFAILMPNRFFKKIYSFRKRNSKLL